MLASHPDQVSSGKSEVLWVSSACETGPSTRCGWSKPQQKRPHHHNDRISGRGGIVRCERIIAGASLVSVGDGVASSEAQGGGLEPRRTVVDESAAKSG
jgi:hypothetical protein